MILRCLILLVHLLLSSHFAPEVHPITVSKTSDSRYEEREKDTYASKVFIVNGFKSAKPSNPPNGLFGPIPLIAEVSRIAFKEGFMFS